MSIDSFSDNDSINSNLSDNDDLSDDNQEFNTSVIKKR